MLSKNKFNDKVDFLNFQAISTQNYLKTWSADTSILH